MAEPDEGSREGMKDEGLLPGLSRAMFGDDVAERAKELNDRNRRHDNLLNRVSTIAGIVIAASLVVLVLVLVALAIALVVNVWQGV